MVIVEGLLAVLRTTGPAQPQRGSRQADTGAQQPRRSGHHVPPFEGEGLPAHVGATVHLPQKLVVRGNVVDEGAAEAQGFQQGAHVRLQAAHLLHLWPEGLGDAQVLVEHDHVHLWWKAGRQLLFSAYLLCTWPRPKLSGPSQQLCEAGIVICPHFTDEKTEAQWGLSRLYMAEAEKQTACFCMYVHACIHGYACTHQYVYAHVCIHMHMCVHVHVSACVLISIS